jgi:RimJ/RimL family protein N-acetyltransferase
MPVELEFAEPGNQRDLAARIAEAVFGTQEDRDFLNHYVPHGARVPSTDAFAQFAATGVKCLAGVKSDDQMVGFILVADVPQHHSIGFGIKRDFAGQGIMSEGLRLFFEENQEIAFPLNAYTSCRNEPSFRLLENSRFERQERGITFAGEDAFHYIRRG